MDYIRYCDLSENEWNQWIAQIDGITFNYTAQRLSFNLEYSQSIVSNESFIVLESKKPVAAAELYIENFSGQHQISWNGGYCCAPYLDKNLTYQAQEKYAKKIMGHIDDVALKYKCDKIKLKADPLGNPDQSTIFYNYNFLLKHGYLDQSGMTQIIDLRQEKDKIYADIRKGHKSDIKRGKVYDVKIYDQYTVKDEMIERYKNIYEADAGRVTRNSQLYRYYLEFIKSGMGILAFGSAHRKEAGVAIVTIYNNTAYYSSYGELEQELDHVPIGHVLQWEIINNLKDRGIEFYEIGEQVFGKTSYHNPDVKLINISSFKRGFGGYTVPFWRGMKLCGQQTR